MIKGLFSKILFLILLLFIISVAVIGLGNAILPLTLAFATSYLIFPLILILEKKGINRKISLLCFFLFFIIFMTIVVLHVLPALFKDIQIFISELPQNINKLFDVIQRISAKLNITFSLNRDSIINYVYDYLSGMSIETVKSFADYSNKIFSSLFKTLIFILNILLCPVFLYYIIIDYEKIINEVENLLPIKSKKYILHLSKRIDLILSGFIRGQLLIAFLLAVFYSISLTLIGLNFGFLIGFTTGLLVIIPYAGFTIGFILALLVAFSNFSFLLLFEVTLVFVLMQLLESFVLTPKIVGDRVGLNPLWSLIAIIISGNIFGFWGILIAIPLFGILRIVLIDIKAKYLASSLYLE